jgi:hypothetical protein
LAFAEQPEREYTKEQADVIQKGEAMVAVQGLYTGGDTVKIDAALLPFKSKPYEVIVTFLRPIQNTQAHDADQRSTDEQINRNPDKRQAGFQAFMKYKGSLPAAFDYRKELSDYREERYGYINGKLPSN